MNKCHCSGVNFESILYRNTKCAKSYDEIAKDCDISQICTACKDDFVDFCKRRLRIAS